jgi:polar amino acid transport system substrate-binding protein
MLKARRSLAVLFVLALVVSVVGLVGCGSKTTTTTAAPTDTTATGTSDTTSAPPASYTLVTPGQITVGSDTSYPPFESMNGTTAEGFDVDLLTAIGQKIGLKVVFQTETFDSLIPTLIAGGKFDVIASSMTITDERKKQIDFSDPYIDSNQSLAVKKGSTIKSEADLKGKKVGVQSGTTGEAWAKENVPGATLVPFKTATEALAALQAGNVDGVVNDLPVSAFLVKDASRGLELAKAIPTGEQYGFGVAKTNAALTAAINKALADLKADGTYKTIYEKWFGATV